MKTYLKITSPWSQLCILLLLLGTAILLTGEISSLILVSRGALISGQQGASRFDLDNPAVVSLMKWLQGFSSVSIFLLPAVLYAWFSFRYRPIWFLGFHKPDKTVFYALALGIALFSFPFAGWLGQINEQIPLPASLMTMEKEATRELEAFMKAGSPLDILYNLLVMALLPAICEEALFRGSLQRILIHAFKNPWVGIIVTAILFSAFHMQFQGFLPRVFLGILLGALYWYSGSLWVNILAHFVINGVQVIAAIFYPKMINDNPTIPIYMALLSAVFVTFLLVKLARESGMTYANVYEVGAVNEYNEFLS
jgi:membrane protease YdiL (CAAX protease family)